MTDMVRSPGGYCNDWIRRNRLVAALTVQAPHADAVIIRVVAALLAGSACSDALLIAADALEEASEHIATRSGDFNNERNSLQVLMRQLRAVAPTRAANELLAGP